MGSAERLLPNNPNTSIQIVKHVKARRSVAAYAQGASYGRLILAQRQGPGSDTACEAQRSPEASAVNTLALITKGTWAVIAGRLGRTVGISIRALLYMAA